MQALCSYTETIPKAFLLSSSVHNWHQEGIFNEQPMRKLVLAMTKFIGFLRATRKTLFHCQNFGLSGTTVFSNDCPIAGEPVITDTDETIYFTSLEALSFGNRGHGFADCHPSNHLLLVLDPTSTQQSSQGYLYHEFNNASFSGCSSRTFWHSIRECFFGKKFFNHFFFSPQRVSKKVFFYSEMNSRRWPTKLIWQRW